MKIEYLSELARVGLRQWARDVHRDDLLFDGIGSSPEHWAWMYFQLRASKDIPEWFPRGKWAILQTIEDKLLHEARAEIGQL